MTQENIESNICCPEFNPTLWDEKVFEWKEKKFIKDKVFTIFYMPVNFGNVMKKLDERIRLANATVPDNLGLSDHTSLWNMDVYLAVDKEIPKVQNTVLSGTFISKVYEGPFNETGKWQKNFTEWCKTQGHKTLKQFMWYTTCPKCAKKYGKNYVVILAEMAI
jgi:hypothetical protein